MGSLDEIRAGIEPSHQEEFDQFSEFLKGKTFEWLMRSPHRAVDPVAAENFAISLSKALKKGRDQQDVSVEALRAYLATGVLADEEIGISWDADKKLYKLVNPPSEKSVDVSAVPTAPELPLVNNRESKAGDQIVPEKLKTDWDELLAMDPQARLDAMRAIYEYLQTYAVPSAATKDRDPDHWYLNEDVLRSFPAGASNYILAHPDIVGYKGEPGTFGGLFITMRLARQFDTRKEEGSFDDHIKLVDKFRNSRINFTLALKIMQSSLEGRKGALGDLISSVYEDAGISKKNSNERESLVSGVESGDSSSETRAGKKFRERREDRAAAAAAKEKKSKPSRQTANPGLAARRPVRQINTVEGGSSTSDQVRARRDEVGSDIDRLSQIDHEIGRQQAELERIGHSVTRVIAIARLQQQRAEISYGVAFEAAGGDIEKRVQSLLDYADQNIKIAFDLEAIRAQEEREKGSSGMVKSIDRGVMNEQRGIFIDILSDIEKAMKAKDMRADLLKALQDRKASINSSLQQYTIETVVPSKRGDEPRPLPTAKPVLRLETTATVASLEEVPERRLQNSLAILSELLAVSATGNVAEAAITTANVATEISRALEALNQMRKGGLTIDIPPNELVALSLIARQKKLPADRRPLQETLGKIRDLISANVS